MTLEITVKKLCYCLDVLLCETKTDDEIYLKPCSNGDVVFQKLKARVHAVLENPETNEIISEFIHCKGKECNCNHLIFLQICLVLLKLLHKALSCDVVEPRSSETLVNSKRFIPHGLLSISQQNVVKKCFQFIVGLGILPNLLPGVGIPLNRRLQHANVFENFKTNSTYFQKHVHLVISLETLLNCLESDAMQSILFNYHGTDLFAALLQLCHAPIKKIEIDKLNADKCASFDEAEFSFMLSAIQDDSDNSESEIVNMMLLHRNYFKKRLEKFLKQISPSLLVWELILLQGVSMSREKSLAKTRCPVWMKKICNQMLTNLILQDHGVVLVVQAVLDKAFDVDLETGKVEQEHMEAVANLITCNYQQLDSLENYVQSLSKQVFQLLHLEESHMNSLLKFIAACIILQLHARNQKLGENYFFKKILHPLNKCVHVTGNNETKIVIKEKELITCIEELHKIFVSCTIRLGRKCIKILYPFFHCLSSLYFFLVKGTFFLKSKVQELLIEILKAASCKEENTFKALQLLSAATIPNFKDPEVYHTEVHFINGDEGGVVAISKKEKSCIVESVHYPAVLDLISKLNDKKLQNSFIMQILKEYCSFHLKASESTLDDVNITTQLAYRALLKELSEWDADIREALVSDIPEVMNLIMTLLDSICNFQCDAAFFEETATVVLIILGSLLTCENHVLLSKDWKLIEKCLPNLKKLQKTDMDSSLKEMMLSLMSLIATRGVASMSDSDSVKELSERFNNIEDQVLKSSDDITDIHNLLPENQMVECSRDAKEETNKIMDLSEKLESHDAQEESSDKSKKQTSIRKENIAETFSSVSLNEELLCASKMTSSLQKCSEYERALREASNSYIPIRGQGLNSLAKLIYKRDDEAIMNKAKILKLFEENVKDEDSYVNLPSIQGMSYIADLDAELVLPTVLNVYQNPDERCDLKLKMGEVLLRICRFLGDIIYKYRDQLLHACLIGTRHYHPQVRSSSLSNLGEACMCLKFNISGHWLQEILVCVLSLLKTDKDLEVRRCSVMVITLLIRGVGKDMLQILQNDIHPIYTQLKLVRDTESDEVLCLHSQLALEEINSVMKDLLSCEVPLTKEIRILP